MTQPHDFTPRKKALVLAISCALASFSTAVLAQEAPAADENLEEVIVKGVRASQAKAIDIKRMSANVVDSIVAEDIGKLPDTTITDSLQRVTGVQISRTANEGTSLNVRGMPQVLTTLNGEQFLSPQSITGVQPDFSDIPAGMISGVDVYKSQSAHTLAGGISGVVDLKTMNPLDLKEGWTLSQRVEAAQGSRSRKETKADGTTDTRDPDYAVSAIFGYNADDKFAVYANLYRSESNAANYSMWENHVLGFLDGPGGEPGDPYDIDGDGDLVGDWYIVPEEYAAESRFMEREREGGSLSAEYQLDDNWSLRGDVFYTRMDQFDRSVRAGFGGKDTPVAFEGTQNIPGRQRDLFDALQPGSVVSKGATISFVDTNGVTQTRDIHSLRVANVWSSGFTSTSGSEIARTAAINSNVELSYTNNENFDASVRVLHAKAEKQQRKASLQQGIPAWALAGRVDKIDGYKVTVDYTGEFPRFSYADDLSNGNQLKNYQGIADGYNTDAELSVARTDLKWTVDKGLLTSIEGGLRYGERDAYYNKFFYMTPTGRYSSWEDPRVPVDKQFQLLPGNFAWQKYPDWQSFDYNSTDSQQVALRDKGGLLDNGFSSADTIPFTDFGPIKGFERGIASLNPAAWDSPYEFMNRLYPGTRTVNDPAFTYDVNEASSSGFVQFNLANDSAAVPFEANIGVQVVRTDRTTVKSVLPDVLDAFNSLGYDDWQKVAYIYDTASYKNSHTDVLPSANLNLFPMDDVVLRFGYAETITRNDLENVGSSLTVWMTQCTKTDENGNPITIIDNNGQTVNELVSCVAGGSDNGNPNIKPWSASVWNASGEWYFAESSILGLGLFLIQVDTAVESLQEQRNFLDMDGINRNRYANVYTTRNVGASDLYGVEFGYKQPFSFLPGSFLSSTGLEFNYTYSESESTEVDLLGDKLPLPSNSKHQTNLILWYDRSGLNVRLAYNWRSEEYASRGGVNTNAAVLNLAQWIEPVGYLDLSVSYWVDENLSLYVNGTNLTEESRKGYKQFESQFSSLWVQERRFAAGVNFSF